MFPLFAIKVEYIPHAMLMLSPYVFLIVYVYYRCIRLPARERQRHEKFRREATPQEWERYLMEKDRDAERAHLEAERKAERRHQGAVRNQQRVGNALGIGAKILMGLLKK